MLLKCHISFLDPPAQGYHLTHIIKAMFTDNMNEIEQEIKIAHSHFTFSDLTDSFVQFAQIR